MQTNTIRVDKDTDCTREKAVPTRAQSSDASPRDQLLAYAARADDHHIRALLSIQQTHLGDFNR